MTNTERILTALLTHGPMSDSELRRQTGVEPHQQVNQICRRLAQQGRVRRAPGPDGLILNQLMDEPAMPTAMQATASSSRQPSVQRCSVAHPAPVEPVALSDERTLLLRPCSGAKAAGGRPVLAGPSVSDYLDDELAASLRSARSEVAAVAAVDERLVLPACQRYTGTLYRSAVPVLANEQAIRRVAILSGGYGLVLAGEPIGAYDRRFATGDWPRGLLERCLVALASGLAVDQVVALCARSTGYAELVRRAPWKRAGIEAVLVAPEMQGRGGAQVLVPRAAGEALAAMVQGSLPLAWQSTDGVGVQMKRLA